jgi:PIN domain nuclease of toxin-antitoxin system
MKYLLDTCTFIWFVSNSPELNITAKNIIEDEYSEIFLSIISIWEMSIKNSIGKLEFTKPFEEFIQSQIELNEIEILELSQEHIFKVNVLPFHHKDPFDRLIISQSIVENLPVISVDLEFGKYPIKLIW